MPSALRVGPYRFFFYAGDGAEPVHIHVRRDRLEAKFWLDPVRPEKNRGFSEHELNSIQRLVEEHARILQDTWHDYFKS